MNSQNKRTCKLFAGQAAGWIAFALVILPMFRIAYKGERAVAMMSLYLILHAIALSNRYAKAIQSVLDLMYTEECETTVKINGVILNAWDWGILGNGLYGKIYCYYPETKPQRPMKERDYLFRGNIIYDVKTHGHPDFNKNSLYRITYLRFSKIITKIEDLSPNAPKYPVYVSIDEYARRVIEREERKQKKQRKTERKNKKE